MLIEPIVLDDETAAFDEACSLLVTEITTKTQRDQICTVVLAGGYSTSEVMQRAFQRLSNWANVRLVLADERCLPIGDPNRNDTVLTSLINSSSLISPPQIIGIPAELGPHIGADQFETILNNIGAPDIALLSVADDGHIASLFPYAESLNASSRAVAITTSAKPPRDRVSCTFAYLTRASHRIALQTGHNKRDIFVRLQQGERLPLALFSPTHWIMDISASH